MRNKIAIQTVLTVSITDNFNERNGATFPQSNPSHTQIQQQIRSLPFLL